ILTAAAVLALVALAASGRGGSAEAPLVPPGRLPGELTGAAPWPANTGELRARLRALGLPALAQEGTALHLHQHLDLYVEGRRVVVPAGIGIDPAGRFIAPIHSHDATGIIHVESPERRVFSLGQFFGVWGVRFTPRCLGGYCASGRKRLWVYVDGRLVRGDPPRVALTDHQEIVVALGDRRELPRPIPRSYAFPAGL
ncbi:MAG: hypothetical protein M3304_03705, partial [Actinomycetota bacterium]|nr:hypothetical protein [Actinomycetota bacterium]